MIQQEITAMSFNVFTQRETIPARKIGVAKTIRSLMPDSVGLQEAHEPWRAALWALLRDDYAIACDTGRDEDGAGEGVPIYYLKEKYELADEGVYWLSETPERYSVGWDSSLPRIAGWALLQDKATRFAYVHCNTHFDHRGLTAPLESARVVLERLRRFDGYPIVFTGDLNVTPDTAAIDRLRRGGLQSLQEAAGQTDTGGTFHDYGKSAPKIIDYVFANACMREAKEFRVIRDEYDGTYPSDHFAVAGRMVME